MASKKFAIPLNRSSKQTGDITFADMAAAREMVIFRLTNATSAAAGNRLSLITKKGGITKEHNFDVTFTTTEAKATVPAEQIANVFADADGGDWDYVEADWQLGGVDTPNKSNNYEIQNGVVYNSNGWPPKTS